MLPPPREAEAAMVPVLFVTAHAAGTAAGGTLGDVRRPDAEAVL